MKRLIRLLLLATLLFSGAVLANATPAASATTPTALQACPQSSERGFDTAQISQSDCCKGHKGVCGCRAGKIVCCDNTTSPNCTCHGDQGLAN